jgi:hypothetical protein
MTWEQVPYATSDSSIAMEATTAIDESWVEYYFECTAGGGHDSGWQYSPFYEDSGLLPGTTYSYRVWARDRSLAQHTTDFSGVVSVMTMPDATPPEPNPMTWAHPPGEQNGFDWIIMEAATAADPCGLEYYFECTAGGGHDSGWQDSPIYEDWPLDVNSQYTYRVRARDKSPAQNATGWSAEVSTSTTTHCPPVFDIAHVESIVCGVINAGGGNKAGIVIVTVVDDCGNPVAGVKVEGTFTGDFTEQFGSSTDQNGVADLITDGQAKNPSYTFCVDMIDRWSSAYTYGERYNVETCDSY